MLEHFDRGAGRVMDTISGGVWESARLLYLADDGGAGAKNADNSPLDGLELQKKPRGATGNP
jgi:hypothetical protein